MKSLVVYKCTVAFGGMFWEIYKTRFSWGKNWSQEHVLQITCKIPGSNHPGPSQKLTSPYQTLSERYFSHQNIQAPCQHPRSLWAQKRFPCRPLPAHPVACLWIRYNKIVLILDDSQVSDQPWISLEFTSHYYLDNTKLWSLTPCIAGHTVYFFP